MSSGFFNFYVKVWSFWSERLTSGYVSKKHFCKKCWSWKSWREKTWIFKITLLALTLLAIQLTVFCFQPYSRFVRVQMFQQVLFISISLDIQNCNSESPLVVFSPSKSKTKLLWTGIRLKNHCFFLFIKILIVQNFQVQISVLIFHNIQTHFHQNYKLYLFH